MWQNRWAVWIDCRNFIKIDLEDGNLNIRSMLCSLSAMPHVSHLKENTFTLTKSYLLYPKWKFDRILMPLFYAVGNSQGWDWILSFNEDKVLSFWYSVVAYFRHFSGYDKVIFFRNNIWWSYILRYCVS